MSNTPNICYFDLEVDPKSNKILVYGAVLNSSEYRGLELSKFKTLGQTATTLCGHNIIQHDLAILKGYNLPAAFFLKPKIDTLYLSVLLFPKKPYHHLVKDYQLNGTEINNPLADAKLTKILLEDLLVAFQQLPQPLRTIYYNLLKNIAGFDGFFNYIASRNLSIIAHKEELARYIQTYFATSFCRAADLLHFIEQTPIELAFAMAIITVEDKDCFRRFEGDAAIPLQEQVVEAALVNQSFVAIFPTGGGKSLTFQLPALMRGAANRSLTVIISPLQSLMKDQVDVLRNRHSLTEAVTINGLLSPLERSDAIERVENGGANLLYISPESLRSNTIRRLLKRRIINRFVIDEAHCFSSWGQDFRVDYQFPVLQLRQNLL